MEPDLWMKHEWQSFWTGPLFIDIKVSYTEHASISNFLCCILILQKSVCSQNLSFLNFEQECISLCKQILSFIFRTTNFPAVSRYQWCSHRFNSFEVQHSFLKISLQSRVKEELTIYLNIKLSKTMSIWRNKVEAGMDSRVDQLHSAQEQHLSLNS